MLNKEQLDKINQYLCYLACGIENNGLSKEAEREVLDLGCRCLDEIEKIEVQEKANEVYFGKC